MPRGVRVFITSAERESIALEIRVKAVIAYEKKHGWDYCAGTYRRYFKRENAEHRLLSKEEQRRLSVLLEGLRDLYLTWSQLSDVMRVPRRTLQGAWRGEKRFVTYALAVYVAEAAGMNEERFFRQKTFRSPLQAVDKLDQMLDLPGDWDDASRDCAGEFDDEPEEKEGSLEDQPSSTRRGADGA